MRSKHLRQHLCDDVTMLARIDLKTAFALLTSLVALAANAKTFVNSYVSFEIGSRWNCSVDGTEWICQTNAAGEIPAVIILTAKEMGPQDNLGAYQTHLKKPKSILSRTGQPLQSTVYQVAQETINNQPWVNGFHFSSELVNYYTRYLATVKNGIAVVVTFSAHRKHYTEYSADFFHAIQSLNILVTKGARKWENGQLNDLGRAGENLDSIFPVEADSGEARGDSADGGLFGKTKGTMGLAVIGIAIGLYLILKRRSKRQDRRPGRRK